MDGAVILELFAILVKLELCLVEAIGGLKHDRFDMLSVSLLMAFERHSPDTSLRGFNRNCIRLTVIYYTKYNVFPTKLGQDFVRKTSDKLEDRAHVLSQFQPCD